MKIILKCASHECSPDDIEWAIVTLDAPLLERALARRRLFRHAQAQDAPLCEMYFWDTTPDFFALYPGPTTDQPFDDDESLEDALRDHTGQPIAWADDLHRVHDETAIPDAYLRGVECTLMRVDTHGIDWVCYPKHLDAEIRTSTIPWTLIEEQRLFAPQPDGC
jgi:hypothetical protein